MKIVAGIVTLIAVASIGCGDARSEVFSRSYSAPGWNIDASSHYYMDVSVDLGFGVAAVDSVWVEITGVTRIGTWIMDLGGVWLPVACRDGLFASFIGEPSQGNCGDTFVVPDGVPDCIGGAHTTVGLPGDPFTANMYMSAVEWSSNPGRSFSVVAPRPELGDLFRDGVATLRLKEIDYEGYYACVEGLADIASITVSVAYNPALPVEHTNWGSLKAQYR